MVSMTAVVPSEAPAQRLAACRIVLGVFVVSYLILRLPVFLELATRSGPSFDGVGVMGLVDGPLPPSVVRATLVLALVSGVAFVAGWRFRITAPVFAACVLLLTSYRSSWGQMLHFENVFVLHLFVVGLSPAADAWSLDERSGRRRAAVGGPAYGWPLQLAAVVVVTTYVIAGIAKLRYGGVDWLLGDTLRNHVAYSAVRLDLLGSSPSPFAEWLVPYGWLFPPMAITSVVLELAAPFALLSRRFRNVWIPAIWLMHVGIFALMLVGFPYPLFLAAFAPFVRLERVPGRAREIALR
jgi:hypothetical protein